jgi:hypothetical protein
MSEKRKRRDDKGLLTVNGAKKSVSAYKKFCERRGLTKGFNLRGSRKRG